MKLHLGEEQVCAWPLLVGKGFQEALAWRSLSIGKFECQLLWQSRPLVLQDEVIMPSSLTKPALRPFWVLVLGLESESRSALLLQVYAQ